MKKTKTAIPSICNFYTLHRLKIVLSAVVILVISLGWFVSFHYKKALQQAVIDSYHETQLEIVRSVSRAIELYVVDESAQGTDITTIEQNILKRFISPIHLLKNGDAWIYAPDHVVFDLSSDFPDEYRGKSMAEIFAIQKQSGASHYEEMTDDIFQAREGKGWYIWLIEKGPEIAAWTPVKFKKHVWTIGISTPLFEILEATNTSNQIQFITRILVFATILSCVLLMLVLMNSVRRHKLENEAYDTKEKLQALIEAIPDVIYFKDKKGRYLLVNRAFEKILKSDRKVIIGKTDSELFTIEESQIHLLSDNQVFEQRKPHHAEERYLNERNKTVFFETNKIPLLNNQNDLIGLVGISRDITERKRNEEALEGKIVALTRALDDVGSITFEDLFRIEDIQRLQDEFSEATGVASLISRPDGTPITKPSNFCRFCDMVRNTEKGSEKCIESDTILGQYNPDGPSIHPCYSGGLWDAGAPISIGGKHIATWLIGQVRDETQTEERMHLFAQEIGIDENDFLHAFNEIPSMSHERFKSIGQVLFTLSNQLSMSAYQNVQQARFITERKTAEDELKKEQFRLSEIIRGTNVGTCEWNVQSDEILINDRMTEILGCKKEDLLPLSKEKLKELVHPDDLKNSRLKLNKLFRRELEYYKFELRIKYKDENWKWYLIRGKVSSWTDEGKPLLLFGTLADIEERKRLEDERQTFEKMKTVGTLAGGIAHDFNNILTGLFGYISMAKLKLNANYPGYEYLEAAEKAMGRATLLSNQLLTFAKGGAPVKENLSLTRLVEEVVHFNLTGSNVKPAITAAGNLWLVKADQGQLQQVFGNLTINAKQAMPEGGHLNISMANIEIPDDNQLNLDGGKYIQITFSDEGKGIAPEDKDRIFEPYFTTKETGNGLGLATIYSIINRHNGHISVSSELGKGATFMLYLPAVEIQAVAQASAESVLPYKGHSAKILVMDDDEEIRFMLQSMLKELSYTVKTCSNGRQAVELYGQGLADKVPYDLVILDLTVPGGMGGKETAQKILQLDVNARLFVSSGYAEDPVMSNYLDYGFSGIITKPYDFKKLTNTLNRFLGHPAKKPVLYQ